MVHAEERPFAGSLVADVGVLIDVAGQRVILGMVQAISVSRYAGHEDVAGQVAGNCFGCSLYLLRRGAAFPVIGDIKYRIKPQAGQGGANAARIVSVCHDTSNFTSKGLLGTAMEQGHLVTFSKQPFHQQFAYEKRPTNNENAHLLSPSVPGIPGKCFSAAVRPAAVLSRSIPDLGV